MKHRITALGLVVAFSSLGLFACASATKTTGTLAPNETLGADDAAIRLVDTYVGALALDRARSGWRTRLPPPPRPSFDPHARYYWTLETNRGPLKFRLRPDVAPLHVASTAYLTRAGFFEGLRFHRIVPGFVVQSGCPIGDGRGSPGYVLPAEPSARLRHDAPGVLSSANSGPGTEGSQFFVTLQRASHLDGRHTVFGRLVAGEETLRKIEKQGSASGDPRRPVVIRNARITVARGRPIELAPDPSRAAPEAVVEIRAFIDAMPIDRTDPRWRVQLPRPPRFAFDPQREYAVVLDTTEGALRFRLWTGVAPLHATSFLYLTLLGFYDGLTFHRVIPDFMAQGGCPRGDGHGTPGYRFGGEFRTGVGHSRRGLLCAANRGPGTDGCQFFVSFVPLPHLDGKNTLFGELVEGRETLDRIESLGTRLGTPARPIVIRSARVEVDGEPVPGLGTPPLPRTPSG